MNRVGRVRFVRQCAASWWNIMLEFLCKTPPQPHCFYVSAKRETERAWHHYFTLIPVQSRSLFPSPHTCAFHYKPLHPTLPHTHKHTHKQDEEPFDAIRTLPSRFLGRFCPHAFTDTCCLCQSRPASCDPFCLDFHRYMVAMTTGPFMKALQAWMFCWPFRDLFF